MAMQLVLTMNSIEEEKIEDAKEDQIGMYRLQ